MPLATIHKMGPQSDLYVIHFVSPTDPGFGGGRPAGPDSGYDRPSGGHPDQGLPGQGGHPSHGLPGQGIPGNELPDAPPPNLAPGYTLVLVRHDGKWVYAAIAPGSPPPRPLPAPTPPTGPGYPNLPNQGLPGGPPAHGPGPGAPNRPDQGLPGGPPNYPTGQPVPPTGTPTAR